MIKSDQEYRGYGVFKSWVKRTGVEFYPSPKGHRYEPTTGYYRVYDPMSKRLKTCLCLRTLCLRIGCDVHTSRHVFVSHTSRHVFVSDVKCTPHAMSSYRM
eukprot:g62961.t1